MTGCPISYEALLDEEEIECPNCGEFITVVIDKTVDAQQYIEDCSVCCQAMIIRVNLDDEFNQLSISNETDPF